MPGCCVVTDISWNMLFNSNLKALGSAPYICGITGGLIFHVEHFTFLSFLVDQRNTTIKKGSILPRCLHSFIVNSLNGSNHNTNHRVTLNESEKKDKYLDLAQEQKKTVEHESDFNTNCNWCSRYSLKDY